MSGDLTSHKDVTSNTEIRSRLSAAVRRHSPVPLHHQIKIAVLEGVEGGWLEPGAQLPRERELAETLGVSLAPVRQAMADLTKEAMSKNQGQEHPSATGAGQEFKILGAYDPSAASLGRGQVPSSDMTKPPRVVDAAPRLHGGTPGAQQVRSIDGEPLALLTAWLQPRYARGVIDGPGAGSLYQALRHGTASR